MNHLESASEGKNNIWRYVVMIGAVIIVINTIGSIPLFIGYWIKAAADPGLAAKVAANPSGILGSLGYDSNIGLLMMLFPFVSGIIAFILLIKPLNSRTITQTINGTSTIRWRRFFISGVVWAILSGIYLIVYLKIEPANFTLNNTSVTLIYLSIISFLFIPFQAAFEEVLFRGYFMQGFAVIARNRWFPLLMTSILFALMHFKNPEVKEFGFITMMPQYLLFGLVFGITAIMDDGIEVAMGAHIANNIFLCIFVTNSSSALQTSALYVQKQIFPWTEFFGLLIASVIFLIVLKMIFKWEDYSRLWGNIPVNEAIPQPE